MRSGTKDWKYTNPLCHILDVHIISCFAKTIHLELAIKVGKYTNPPTSLFQSFYAFDKEFAHEHMKMLPIFQKFHDMTSTHIVKVLHRKRNSKIHNVCETAPKTPM